MMENEAGQQSMQDMEMKMTETTINNWYVFFKHAYFHVKH